MNHPIIINSHGVVYNLQKRWAAWSGVTGATGPIGCVGVTGPLTGAIGVTGATGPTGGGNVQTTPGAQGGDPNSRDGPE